MSVTTETTTTTVKKKFTFTPAQQLVISGLWSLLIGAGAATISAIGLSYISIGLDLPVLINIGLVAFGAAFASSLKNYVPAHMTQICQATEDAYTEVLGSHRSTIATLNNVITTLTTQVTLQPVQSVPSGGSVPPAPVLNYIPKVVQSVPDMPTQTIAVVKPPAQVDLLANVPQNQLAAITGGVTGQFIKAGLPASNNLT